MYELPFGQGKRFLSGAGRAANLFVGGWQLNSISSWMSGVPRIVSSPNLTTLAFVSQRANATGTGIYSSFNGINPREGFGENNKSRFWLNPGAFSQTAPLKFGTSGRNIIQGPAWWNFDLSAFKNFTITENTNLQFRAEAFNAFNNVDFANPNASLCGGNCGEGTITGTANIARQIQFALKLYF